MTEIQNAKIDSTHLGPEDHGIMTAYVYVSGPSWGCGFGGYSLDSWDEIKGRRIGVGFGVDFITSVLRVVGVDRWEKLPGQHVRVDMSGGRITRIGHIIKDDWFNPKDLADELKVTR